MLGVIDFIEPANAADDGGGGSIVFRAKVDDVSISCRFSAKFLEDVNPSLRTESPHEQFEASKTRLLRIAEQKIRAGEIIDGVV